MKRLLPKSEFTRNVLVLMTGTSVSQAIPIAISPVLTRIYSPAEFGVFALFLALVAIFGAVANGRYEMAIMLPVEDEDALNIAALGLCVAVAVSALLLLLVALFNTSISTLLGHPEIGLWLYAVPVTVLLVGFYNVLNYFNIRQKNYGDIAKAGVYKAIVLASVQLVLGFLKAGASGLIAGQVLSNVAANTRLLKNTLAGRKISAVVSLQRMRLNGRRFSDFPRFSLLAVLANTLSNNLGNVLIAMFYSTSLLGQYSLVQRVMGVPAALLGSAVGQVFFQRASEEKRSTGTAINTFRSTLAKLVMVSIPVYAIIFLVADDLFAFVFGERWRQAGEFARILVPLFAIRFVVSPLSTMNQVNLKNKLGMYLNILLLVGLTSTISLSGRVGLSMHAMLAWLSGVMSVLYLFFLWRVYRHVSEPLPAGPSEEP